MNSLFSFSEHLVKGSMKNVINYTSTTLQEQEMNS